MSTSYEYRCLGCGVRYDLDDRSNHRGQEAADLLRDGRGELAALGARHETIRHPAEVLMGLEVHGVLRLGRWLWEHDGHDVRLFSEYGEEWGTCGERVSCSGECHRDLHCSLPPRHEGAHKPGAS
jgi:hypothetical protein